MLKVNYLIIILALLGLIVACSTQSTVSSQNSTTSRILLTSEAGDKQAIHPNIEFTRGQVQGTIIQVFPEKVKQTIDGIGSSFTESSAFVLAHLPVEKRREVMEKIYGENGANFSLTRTHIGACDFSVEGKYSYADVPGDANLKYFSIQEDLNGFDTSKYRGVQDPEYDLLPMIQEALAIKAQQQDSVLNIVGSAWTAPAWMKDIEDWYQKMSEENNWHGSGGSLKPEYVSTYADYLLKYLQAYEQEGVRIWGLTPVNEPHGNNGQWESMNFTPQSQGVFISQHLGPGLKNSQFRDIRLMIFDQNRDGIREWADIIYPNLEVSQYVYGMAVHWYASTYKVFENVFDEIKAQYPQFGFMHTEGCIDDLGKPAPGGIADPEAFQEENWFDNDAFWWNPNATDWAYTAEWAGPARADHPIYTPVHRYARNIIVSLDHWVTGWIDWNIVLDAQGGPNHVGNFCGAPIMIDTDRKFVYYTPIFHVLSQFSRTIRPGDKAVQTTKILSSLDEDALHCCATLNAEGLLSVQVLNTLKQPIVYHLQIGEEYAPIKIAANSVQTVQVQL